MNLQEHLLQTGITEEEWNHRRAKIKENKNKFTDQYEADHACCPHCGYEGHSSTYMGCTILSFNEECEIENGDTYRDDNRVKCGNCGWVGVAHDLIPLRKGDLDV